MTTDTSRHQPRSSYWGLWATVPRELGFLLLGFPIALAGFVVTIVLFSTGTGTIVTFFLGVILLIAALYVSRAFGTVELVRLQWAGRPPIPRPEWQDRRAREGFWNWLRSVLGNGHYWLALLHTMVVDFAVTLFTWTVTVVWVAFVLSGLSFWAWEPFVPHSGGDFPTGRILLSLALGIVALATLPLVTRGLTLLHNGIARGMLGAWKSDALQRQVTDLSASRGAAIAAEGDSLRRLERDIHDGPQQRLVRLQMDLAAADRQLDVDPESARGLIAEAMQQSKDALEELRSLSRGFAPPILLDRGLIAALQSAATRSSIPARVVDRLPVDFPVPQEIERNAYFFASEALTNAIKHSGATVVETTVELRRVIDGDETWLDVTVLDDGLGGAIAVPGHGVAGLEERMRGLGGTLEVSSPPGGPTRLVAHLPVTMTLGRSI